MEDFIKPTFAVAASGFCLPNPGPVKWRIVNLTEDLYGTVEYESQLYEGGTNNIAEFLSIVTALARYEDSLQYDVYSASQTGRVWVGKGYCTVESCKSPKLKEIVVRANTWLKEHPLAYQRVKVWDASRWGPIISSYNQKQPA